jgi:peptidoglycan/LPS O-acetylase OafA/YrhL
MSIDESPLAPAVPVSGTRKRLDHIDAMRPVKQFGVVSTHTLIFFAAAGTGITVGAGLQLLHVTREAFLFISACMITYSFRGVKELDLRSFWRRRFSAVCVPYLCWTLIYFFVTIHGTSGSLPGRLDHLAFLAGTG